MMSKTVRPSKRRLVEIQQQAVLASDERKGWFLSELRYRPARGSKSRSGRQYPPILETIQGHAGCIMLNQPIQYLLRSQIGLDMRRRGEYLRLWLLFAILWKPKCQRLYTPSRERLVGRTPKRTIPHVFPCLKVCMKYLALTSG